MSKHAPAAVSLTRITVLTMSPLGDSQPEHAAVSLTRITVLSTCVPDAYHGARLRPAPSRGAHTRLETAPFVGSGQAQDAISVPDIILSSPDNIFAS